MNTIKNLTVMATLAIAFVVDAQGGCPTLNPTMCEPNNGWADNGPFYSCSGDNGTCCWIKEGDAWCWVDGAWTKTPFKWRFSSYNAYCPPPASQGPYAYCVPATGGGN